MGRPRRLLVLALVAAALGTGCGSGEDQTPPVSPVVAHPGKAETIAERYEPDLMLEKQDGFWPVAVRTIDMFRSGATRTCLAKQAGAQCSPTHIRELPWASGSASSYLDYPAGSHSVDAQREEAVQALKSNAPGTDARIYYYVTGRDPDRPVTLQYWFYYPFNYLEAHLFAGASVNTDLHEGDIEGMALLLSAHKHLPIYVWMPRHREEGERFAWTEGALQLQEGDHPVGYAAKGSHATYESCGRKFRTALVAGGLADNIVPDDYFSCEHGAGYELGAGVPAIDLARTWWACWRGHLGDAPHNPSPLSEIYADGPTSPLYQQKFELREAHPCTGVDPPPPPRPGQERLDDPETAQALEEAGGRLNELFRSCDDWWQRPPDGSYMVACDQETLDSFFDSGLEDPGAQNLRIEGSPAARGSTVPAVFAAPEPGGVDSATIETDQVAHPVVFVAIRDEEELKIARFPEFTLKPGQRLRLKRDSNTHWRLVDVAHGERTVRGAEVHETEAATPPQQPKIVAVERRGESIDLRFRGGANPETNFVVYAGTSREDLLEGGRSVGALEGQSDGEYELTIADPERRFLQVRVVAFNEAARAATPITPVGNG
ncbi:MAG: hypothetical protein ACTHLH_04340 [Solirubrobacterales bacterium]